VSGELQHVEGELDVVRRLVERFGRGSGDEIWLGDDAAVVVGPGRLLLAIDPVVAGVHFDASAAASDVGWNVLARNVSDIAAMGGRPLHALASVVVPVRCPWPLDEVMDGLADASAAFECRVVGGDTSSGPALVVTVAVTGTVDGAPVLRSGARPGDRVFVTGPLGVVRKRHRPRVDAGRAARVAGATAMIDISDGVLLDLRRLATASDVGVRLDAVPVDDTTQRRTGGTADDWMLGDSYELLFTASDSAMVFDVFAREEVEPPYEIGVCTDDPSELRLGDDDLPEGGWEHPL
jgi:thiamine-monophosphate kinase